MRDADKTARKRGGIFVCRVRLGFDSRGDCREARESVRTGRRRRAPSIPNP